MPNIQWGGGNGFQCLSTWIGGAFVRDVNWTPFVCGGLEDCAPPNGPPLSFTKPCIHIGLTHEFRQDACTCSSMARPQSGHLIRMETTRSQP
eukprot:12312533-Karenia_brevis.AAC.1